VGESAESKQCYSLAVLEFYYNYGVKNLLGIRYGYAGLNPKISLPNKVLSKFRSYPAKEGLVPA
jgi:hypothetical protein